GRAGRCLAHGHRLLPVLPVAILDGQRDGAAEGHAPADAGGEVSLVPLDLHASAAAVPTLAAPEVLVEVLFGQVKTGGAAAQDRGGGPPTGLPPRGEAESPHTRD